MQVLGQELIKWYENHKRDLPWRHTKDPYQIWLSEIILQQTRVDQGLPYFLKFVHAFPTVECLASATELEVLNLWQGLGYYSRGRNLHRTAQIIAHEFAGKFPDSYEGLLQLKGIGPYTAAAIASFAYDLPHAVVDGNVFRVLSRYFGISLAINSTVGKKTFEKIAAEVLNKKLPALHNQAIMEFGALHCKPVAPKCPDCPLQFSCVARAEDKVQLLPVKEKKIKVRKRYFVYHLEIDAQNRLAFERRNAGDIWEGLYQFPLQELPTENAQLAYLLDFEGLWKSPKFKHVLTHQKIEAFFVLAPMQEKKEEKIHYSLQEISELPLPRLIDKFLEQHRKDLPI
ncbi:MAG: A/G-specific adenine glycosylase [Flavobacteriales bacterium]